MSKGRPRVPRRPSTPASGINQFSVGQTAKDLDLIAGPLTINGAAAGDNPLALYDARSTRP